MTKLAEMITQLIQFVGYFLAIGSVGFRFGIVRRLRGLSEDATQILRADNAATLGIIGIALLALAAIGGPYLDALTQHKALANALPKDPGKLQFKLTMLAGSLVGLLLVRARLSPGWTLAAIGIALTVLQPVYTGKLPGKVNAVHILAASTWLGTLSVLTLVGIRGVIRSSAASSNRAQLVADLVNSFSPLALTAAAVLAATGVVTAWLHLKRISALYESSYGRALVVKLVLVAIVALLGAWNWRRVRPSLGDEGSEERIRRSATMELAVAGLVLIATSVLVTLPTPR